MSNSKKEKVIKHITFWGVLLVIYYFFNALFSLSIPCIFHELTHLYCPGCGATRMMFSLLKLDFYQAFRYNPLIFILLVCYFFFLGYCLIFSKKFQVPKKVTYIILVIVILFGILRNIPGLEFLIPTDI